VGIYAAAGKTLHRQPLRRVRLTFYRGSGDFIVRTLHRKIPLSLYGEGGIPLDINVFDSASSENE
jgi:hypothetical protein